MDRDDAGVVQFCQSLGFTGETIRKSGCLTNGGRQDFQRHDAVKFLLADLVNRAHAAFADEFEDFKLREMRREFINRRRLEG